MYSPLLRRTCLASLNQPTSCWKRGQQYAMSAATSIRRLLASHNIGLHDAQRRFKASVVEEMASESRVLVLYTGGTIGMKTVDDVYKPVPKHLFSTLRAMPQLHDVSARMSPETRALRVVCSKRKDFVGSPHTCEWLALPPVKNFNRRIVYTLHEYEPIVDSCDVSGDDWARIANDIHQNYRRFDGFVVLHGTDTLAYTASALSFMLNGNGKPIVITGSQIPVQETRSDGLDNFIGALISAGSLDIAEVLVFFNNKLLRGNRTCKIDNAGLDAFDSPNMDPIAEFGIDVEVNWDSVFVDSSDHPLTLHTNMDPNVGVLRIFPSISVDTVKAFCAPPMKGIVLQSYGAGVFLGFPPVMGL